MKIPAEGPAGLPLPPAESGLAAEAGREKHSVRWQQSCFSLVVLAARWE